MSKTINCTLLLFLGITILSPSAFSNQYLQKRKVQARKHNHRMLLMDTLDAHALLRVKLALIKADSEFQAIAIPAECLVFKC